jgi:cystathionine beta-lyase family protein involved in aluminum resistance
MKNILKRSLNFSQIEERIAPKLRQIENVVLHNQHRVLKAFQELNVDETCFYDSTGYGYNDRGRETLDALFAAVFGGEAALVRPHFVSGTHAIACCLYGILNHGERLVSLTGRPYDTLQQALGLSGDTSGKLLRQGITYTEADFCNGIDDMKLDSALAEGAHLVFIQRSRGYGERRSLTVNDIASLVGAVKNRLPAAVILVDNCYGEFVQN